MPFEAIDTQAEKTSSLTRPYVGLRAFARQERDVFFGRDMDAAFLCDKIFSARLTVLYAGSGVGKSSLLHTLVIPKLQSEQATVLCFDTWSGEDPISLLKAALTELARDSGVVDPSAGSPSIVQLMRLIISAGQRTVVLVLDQFEEFLTTNAQSVGSLREELGALVRTPGLDARVVLSLRQEFLAALEPFHQQIVNLFQSTYLLESLDEHAVREAIERPALVFGSSYDQDLVDALVHDLRAGSSQEIAGVASGEIDLPILQLVCDQLWDAAVAAGEPRLTYALYKGLGGADGILERYVKGVMPQDWRSRQLTAHLMVSLAPPSGLKMSYSVKDLTAISGLPEARIAAELQRLSGHRIMRVRDFKSGQRFELEHDAFIRIVSPWRDRVLRREKTLRQALRVATAALFCIGIGIGVYLYGQRELRRNTVGEIAIARKLPLSDERTVHYENAVSYLLTRRSGSARLNQLRDILKNNSDLVPPYYGVDNSGIDFIQFPETLDPDWPLQLHYSSARELELYHFANTWHGLAKFFAQSWGIPVPAQLQLVEEPTYPASLVRITGPAIAALDIEVPLYEKEAFVSSAKFPAQAQEFFDYFRGEWTPIPDVTYGGPWWVVPRWSLPVWKMSGQQATDGSGLPALIVATVLQKNPDRLLSPPAVELLLDRVATKYPQTVQEARSARGNRLGEDLAEIVKLGVPLTGLPLILDALAAYPSESSHDAAARVVSDTESSQAFVPASLHGRWNVPQISAKQLKGNRVPGVAFRRQGDWLAPVESQIRVHMGGDLVRTWTVGESEELSPVLQERLELVRDDFFRRFGLVLTGVTFKDDSLDPLLTNSFRIEVLNQTEKDPEAQPIATSPATALDILVKTLTLRATALRTHLLDAEYAQNEEESIPTNLRLWLERTYSLTDLKLLMRGVINQDAVETQKWAVARPDEIVPAAAPHTLRYRTWLLKSLVFWCAVENKYDTNALVQRLRETQQARISLPPSSDRPGLVEELVAQGVHALTVEQFGDAESSFSRALAFDAKASVNAFLVAYAASLRETLPQELKRGCEDRPLGDLSRNERIDLEDLLAGTTATSDDPVARQRPSWVHGYLIYAFGIHENISSPWANIRSALVLRSEKTSIETPASPTMGERV